ncbi:uncharacterized protein LOC130725961 [Lotus japonicus]|uniref:uncharacterized protein LOC130725961 n=1 Tax=Lotus japonicus TaxID=34305 RepID=UPI002585BA12|nr:uncharacterized protein LOC130725961 [Lotus japonicus]
MKPIATSIDGTFSEIHSSSVSPMFHSKWPLKLHFNGWHLTQKKWVTWVDALHPRYEAVWKKVGIFEAIMSTKCHILKNLDLVFGVAEKWCPETNTFVFPWGEATITLEDVMVLGGYPVLGHPVFTSLQNQEMREVEQKLILAKQEPWRSRKTKAYLSIWMSTFMNNGSEIEHEAFLAAWLSFFVFPHKNFVNQYVFPIAILLARGNPIALAPAVLASIYKDLNLLKKKMVDLTKFQNLHLKSDLNLESPFYLVQIWAWERFKSLQPQPNLTSCGDPALFRWHKVSAMKIDNVRLALNSAMDDFLWRPYVRYGGKCRALYPENEIQISFEVDLDKELTSFVICMRVSELVGFDSTIMQYFPYRVSMQFGMDQDIPGIVPVFKGTRATAWENYCRPISHRNLYFPSRLFEADVTTSYARWWKQLVLDDQDFAKRVVRRKRSARSSKHGPHVVKANISRNDADIPPEALPKIAGTVKSFDDGSRSVKVENGADVPPGFAPNIVGTVKSFDDGSISVKVVYDADVPPGFAPKVVGTVKSFGDGSRILKVENDVDVPPGFPPQVVGTVKSFDDGSRSVKVENDADVPPGFLPKLVSSEARASNEGVSLSGAQGESHNCESEVNVVELKPRVSRLERVIKKLKIARFGHR